MNKAKLTAKVTQELDQLRLVAEHAAELGRVPANERRPWHAAAAAKYAADLAGGLENLYKRRCREVKWELVDEPLRLLPETIAILREVWLQWVKQAAA